MSLVACGGSAADRSTTPDEGASAHVAPTPPERPWETLSMEERRAHMSRHVVPVMSELFAGYDADRYPEVSCGTCHGENASERSFAMPNAELPALYPTGSIGQIEMVERNPDAARFMFSEVLPAMQTLLGAEDYDPTTGEGFSCYSCHTHAADDDPRAAPAPTARLDGSRSF